MERIDALGPRPDRHPAFARELLAETSDADLQRIVERAARDLSTPIALVTLVLDQVQFFKAHYGLPEDLAAARGTRRDVSFCQFVVRDEEPLEVNDAAEDPDLPQHVVDEYGIRAYLGMPIRAQDVVVGSLCVLDTEPREFSEEERNGLARLAEEVDERLAALTESRRQARLAMSEATTGPGLAELRESLLPIPGGVEAGLTAIPAIRSFLDLSAHALDGGSVSPESMRQSLEAAREATERCEDTLYDIEAAAGDCADCVVALDALTTPAGSTRLSDVLTAAQDLVRQSTRVIGGAPLPDMTVDPFLYTARPLAVALLATTLTSLATRLAEIEDPDGLKMELAEEDDSVTLSITAAELAPEAVEQTAAELSRQLDGDPTVTIRGDGGTLRLAFKVAEPEATH